MSNIIAVLADHPGWFINDMVVLILFIATAFFIIKKEEHPTTILLEAVAFIFLYSVIFDNVAINYLHRYTYGRSIFMFGDVILSMPLTEWMVVYYVLRLLSKGKMPVWIQPIIVALFGFLTDLSLDPVAVRQIADGQGRWTWIMPENATQYLGIPIYNFLGWFLMPFYASIVFLIGRHLYKKSGYKPGIGIAYPIFGAIGALLLLFSPISKFLIYAFTPMKMDSIAVWYTLAIWTFVGFLGIFAIWKFRMKSQLDLQNDWPVIVIPTVLHIADIIGALILKVPAVTINAIVVAVLHLGIIFIAFSTSRKNVEAPKNLAFSSD